MGHRHILVCDLCPNEVPVASGSNTLVTMNDHGWMGLVLPMRTPDGMSAIMVRGVDVRATEMLCCSECVTKVRMILEDHRRAPKAGPYR